MKRKVFISLMQFILIMFLLSGCAGTQLGKTGTTVVTYESVAIGLKTAYVYFTEKEKNGTLTGSELVSTKAQYNLARSKFILAGDALKASIENPKVTDIKGYQTLLEEAAKILANMQGGKK